MWFELTNSHVCGCFQNGNEAQNRSIKVLGFQMKVLVALVSDYIDSVAACLGCVFQLILCINRYVVKLELRYNRNFIR
jgi:hypothetical protein